MTPTSIPGVATVNNGGLYDVGNIDGTHGADRTLAERAGIQIATDFVKIAREWRIPGLSQCHLLFVADAVAYRETRCIVGDYVITAEHVIDGLVPDDTIARAHEDRLDAVYYHAMAKGRIGIPYRALLPRGIEGMLVAGRCISATQEGLAGFRGMGTVMNIGQGAGVAAALAVRKGITPRQVNPREVRSVLIDEMDADL